MPATLVTDALDLAGVDAGAHLDAERRGVALDGPGAADGTSRTVERGQDPVAGHVHLPAAVTLDGGADDVVMLASSSRQRRSPSSAARAVESTMSVKSTVASTRSTVAA